MKCRADVRLLFYDPVVLAGLVDGVNHLWYYVPRFQYEKIRTHLLHARPGKALAIIRKYDRKAEQEGER